MDFIAVAHRAVLRPGAGAGAVDKDIHPFWQPAVTRKDFSLEFWVAPHQVTEALSNRFAGDINLPHSVNEGLQRWRDIDFYAHIDSKTIISLLAPVT
jgi:hypothetical protein